MSMSLNFLMYYFYHFRCLYSDFYIYNANYKLKSVKRDSTHPLNDNFIRLKIQKMFMFSKLYESTAVDYRTWLHCTYGHGDKWSISSDTYQLLYTALNWPSLIFALYKSETDSPSLESANSVYFLK